MNGVIHNTNRKLLRIYATVVVLNTALFSLLCIFFPEQSDTLFAEDNLVENLSAVFYLLSFFLGMFAVTQAKEKKHRKFYVALPVISLFFLAEELDFAQRILHFEPPLVYHIHFDTVHDLIPIAHEFLQVYIGSFADSFLYEHFHLYARILIDLCLIGLLAAALAFLWKHRNIFYRLSEILQKYPSIGLFLIAGGFLSSVQVFDLNILKPPFIVRSRSYSR